jgi:hypothetical protein
MAVNVTEQEAARVVEAARETEWKLPSFGKELFLGNFRLDLIHPQPPRDPSAVERASAFSRACGCSGRARRSASDRARREDPRFRH